MPRHFSFASERTQQQVFWSLLQKSSSACSLAGSTPSNTTWQLARLLTHDVGIKDKAGGCRHRKETLRTLVRQGQRAFRMGPLFFYSLYTENISNKTSFSITSLSFSPYVMSTCLCRFIFCVERVSVNTSQQLGTFPHVLWIMVLEYKYNIRHWRLQVLLQTGSVPGYFSAILSSISTEPIEGTCTYMTWPISVPWV